MEKPPSPPNHDASAAFSDLNGTSPSPPCSLVAEILEPPPRFSSDSSEIGTPRPESPTVPLSHQQLVSSPEERRPEAVARRGQPSLGPIVNAELAEETQRQREARGRMAEGDVTGPSVPEEVRPQPTITLTETETGTTREYVGYEFWRLVARGKATQTQTEARGRMVEGDAAGSSVPNRERLQPTTSLLRMLIRARTRPRTGEYVGYYVLHPAAVTVAGIAKQEREMQERGMAGIKGEKEPEIFGSQKKRGTPTSRFLLERWTNRDVKRKLWEGLDLKGDHEENKELGKGKGKEEDEGEGKEEMGKGKGKEKDEGEAKENEK
ncbi:MAG: hypothetical protein Q9167_004396 [Letrouitia subvulpina]